MMATMLAMHKDGLITLRRRWRQNRPGPIVFGRTPNRRRSRRRQR